MWSQNTSLNLRTNGASFSDPSSPGSARNAHIHTERICSLGNLNKSPRIWSTLDWSILLPLPYELLEEWDKTLFLCLSFQSLSHRLFQRRHSVSVCWRKELIALSCPWQSTWELEAITWWWAHASLLFLPTFSSHTQELYVIIHDEKSPRYLEQSSPHAEQLNPWQEGND